MFLLRSQILTSAIKCQRQYSVLCKGVNGNNINIPPVLISSKRCLLWERDRKGGYDTEIKISYIDHIKNGMKEWKNEFKLFKQEMKEYFEADPILLARPGEIDVVWCFDKPEVLEQFVATSDSDHNEGFSACRLERSPAGRALFAGHLDTTAPRDGRVRRAGYCAIRSKRIRKSFKRASWFDWHMYNTVVLKVRGDGRCYLLNLTTEGAHDLAWNDVYHCPLHTRGGPYWQIAKIPFSKFVLGSKGRLQDKQMRFQFDKVTHFGIACGDKINGKFNLEIEYIGVFVQFFNLYFLKDLVAKPAKY